MNTIKKTFRFLTGLVLMTCALLTVAPPARAALNDWSPLSYQEKSQYGWSHVGVFDATNFAASVTNALNAAANTLYPRPLVGTATFPSGTRIQRVAVHVSKAVATSGGATSYALNIGDCVMSNRFVSALAVGTNIGTGVLETNSYTGLIGYNGGNGPAGTWSLGSWTTNIVYGTATNISLWLLGVADVNANITSGRFEIYLDAVPLGSAVP